ncbi:hypothetical protein OIE66_41105 [Nonomuraea sp. NBC_01738]|uniref:hypothetical protein n=1 Tax=Nonomuraea sp. NBC_01738 TaxID=2976003 RepID=UPI002E1156C4|nr:hypothetical protein OIE66_41105 [Nonomuraea sp. NBC_01738]
MVGLRVVARVPVMRRAVMQGLVLGAMALRAGLRVRPDTARTVATRARTAVLAAARRASAVARERTARVAVRRVSLTARA